MNVPQNATTVDSPEVTPSDAGTYYWREKLVEKSTKRLVHYGDARVPGETVIVGELAKAGIASGFIIPLIGMLAVAWTGIGGRFRRQASHRFPLERRSSVRLHKVTD